VKYILIVTILLLLPMTLMAKPVKNFALDEPDTAFVSNSVIDIIVHDEALWMATSEGVNFSFDGGDTWLLYNTDPGLPANQVSALFSLNNRLWLGVGHTELVNEYSISSLMPLLLPMITAVTGLKLILVIYQMFWVDNVQFMISPVILMMRVVTSGSFIPDGQVVS